MKNSLSGFVKVSLAILSLTVVANAGTAVQLQKAEAIDAYRFLLRTAGNTVPEGDRAANETLLDIIAGVAYFEQTEQAINCVRGAGDLANQVMCELRIDGRNPAEGGLATWAIDFDLSVDSDGKYLQVLKVSATRGS